MQNKWQFQNWRRIATACWLSMLASSGSVLTSGYAQASIPEPQSWRLLVDKHGIQTFSGELPGSRFIATRHIVELETPVEQVLAALGDGSSCAPWLKLCKSMEIIQRINQHEFLAYAVLNMPWPVSERDLVFLSRRSEGPVRKHIIVEQTSQAAARPPSALVRMVSDSRFLIEPLAPGKVRLTWTIHSDPGGSVSPAMINARAPKETRRDLRALVKYLAQSS